MTKEELRSAVKERRAGLKESEKKELDFAIAKRIAVSDVFRNASMLLLYAPKSDEIDLLPLVKKARSLGKTVAFPRCDPGTLTMAFYILESEQRLVPGAYGIYEPPIDAKPCIPDADALCILPGVAFDAACNRLGRGKGYYDRFLERFPGVPVGVTYDAFLEAELPTDPGDRPVQMLFTESKTLFRSGEVKTDSVSMRAERLLDSMERRAGLLRAAIRQEAILPLGPRKIRPLKEPPLLVCAVFILLTLVRLLGLLMRGTVLEAVLMIPLQALIFLLPAMGYFKWLKSDFRPFLKPNLPRINHIWFLFCLYVVMLSGSLLSGIFTGGISDLGGEYTLYSTFVMSLDRNFLRTLYLIVAYALIPAVFEEFVFRGILCSAYERFGAGIAVFVSALFFSMLHFSFPLFFTYLLLGILLGFSYYATKSLLSPMILHFCYNLFCLFGQPVLSEFYVNAGNSQIFLFLVTVIFLLFGAFSLGEVRKIYHLYAREGQTSVYGSPLPLKEYPRALLKVLFTKATLGCLFIWALTSLINLF